MIEHPTDETADLKLRLEYALGEVDAWKGRAKATGQELHRTKLLLEVAETKFANLQKILDRYPLGKSCREIALQMAVQLSGPLDQDDILRTAIRFEGWLLNSADDE